MNLAVVYFKKSVHLLENFHDTDTIRPQIPSLGALNTL